MWVSRLGVLGLCIGSAFHQITAVHGSKNMMMILNSCQENWPCCQSSVCAEESVCVCRNIVQGSLTDG